MNDNKKHFWKYRATNCESVSHYFGLIFCEFSKVKGNLVHQTHEITSLLDQRISVGSIDTNPISHMHPGYTKVPLCLLLLLLPISSKFLIFLYIYIYILHIVGILRLGFTHISSIKIDTHAQLSKSSFLAQIIN